MIMSMAIIMTTIIMMMMMKLPTVCQGAVSDCSPVYWWTEAATR